METVPNRHHDVVKLADGHRLVLQYVTGDDPIDGICERVKEHVEKGDLTLKAGRRDLDVTAEDSEGVIRRYVEETLDACARNALLIA